MSPAGYDTMIKENMTSQEQNLIAIIRAWNPAVAGQMEGCLGLRESRENTLQSRNSSMTTTLTALLVEAKNMYGSEKRPSASLDRINRCLKVLSQE